MKCMATNDYNAFAGTQVIERLLVENRNCLVLYPTGGGKSLCYQIPGLCKSPYMSYWRFFGAEVGIP